MSVVSAESEGGGDGECCECGVRGRRGGLVLWVRSSREEGRVRVVSGEAEGGREGECCEWGGRG